MTIGVYKITNTKNNQYYVGSSINIEKRFKQHLHQLITNTHYNKYLQNTWNKHGESVFNFSIVEKCDEYNLFKTEQKYLDNDELKYNLAPIAGGGTKNIRWSDRSKQKLSNIVKYQYKHDIKQSAMKGKTHDIVTRNIM